MDIQEFSDTFDTILSSYNFKPEFGEDISRADLAFDEYEKSIFLTQAQEQIVLEKYKEFENNEESRKSLLSLIKTIELPLKETINEKLLGTSSIKDFVATANETDTNEIYKYQIKDYKPYIIDKENIDKLLFILEEHCKGKIINCKNLTETISIQVVPVRLDDLNKTLNNPFKCPSKRKICRIMTDNKIILYYKNNGEMTFHYFVTYLKRPNPIILCNLEEVSIESEQQPMEIETDEILHYSIVERAVYLAIKSRIKGNKTQ